MSESLLEVKEEKTSKKHTNQPSQLHSFQPKYCDESFVKYEQIEKSRECRIIILRLKTKGFHELVRN
tara:strand:+ start:305 stop:505 length:201 start_codon:yes stop_codon:yes gene_type:complete